MPKGDGYFAANDHEEFEIVNYSGDKTTFMLELGLRSDFADIAKVRANNIILRGEQETRWDAQAKQLRTTYDHKDYHLALAYQVANVDTPIGYANGRLFFEIELGQHERWQACSNIILEHGKHSYKPDASVCSIGENKLSPADISNTTSFKQQYQRWQERCTTIVSANNDLHMTYQQAIDDMGALRIYDMDISEEAWVPAGGVP